MATMKIILALIAVCLTVPTEAVVHDMWYFHKTLAGMFSKSCASVVPDHSGLDQLKEEIKECDKAKAVPVPGEVKLKGVPVGLEDSFPGEYLYASSFRDDYSTPQRGRLNLIKSGKLNGAWCSEINNDIQFFQVDLGALHEVTGIITQGDHNELNWVRRYTLEISIDGLHWSCVFGSDGRVKIFDANVDSDSPVTNVMHPVIHTRYIRIVPKSWTNHICLRVEIYVIEILPRDEDEPEPIPDFETKPLGVNPKRPQALIVKSYTNQVDRGVVPEEWTETRQAPIKSISYGSDKDQPELFRVNPAGVAGAPINPYDVNPLVISGGGPVIDHIHPGVPDILGLPQEVATYGPNKPKYFLHFKWYPDLEPQQGMYVEFYFGVPVSIRGILTSGRPGMDQFVKVYMIKYLHPYSKKWVVLRNKDQTIARIPANDDDSSDMEHIFFPAIFTYRLQLYILEWENKAAMSIKLSFGAAPRTEAQILTGPVYTNEENSISWAWNNRDAEEEVSQEIYFYNSLTLLSLELDESSTIETYKLQYLVGKDQWQEEDQTFSGGKINLGEVEAEGLKIIVLSFEEEDNFFGQFTLKIKEDVSGNDLVEDIVEGSSYYISFEWEDSSPSSKSTIFFDLEEEHKLTKIGTTGLNGAWVSRYELECRAHREQQGTVTVYEGNDNDKDIVEHDLDIQCKYVIIRPVGDDDGIGMKVYLYSDTGLESASAEITKPGGYSGNFEGEYDGNGPVILETSFNHHITMTRISFEALEESEVKAFEVHISDDAETYQAVLDKAGGIREFVLENYEDLSLTLRGLRILPKNAEGYIGFTYNVDYLAEQAVEAKVRQFTERKERRAHATSQLSGQFNSGSDSKGQYVRVEFPKVEIAHEFTLTELPGCEIVNIELSYKESLDGKYKQIKKEPTIKDGVRFLDLGDLKLAELKIVILEVEGIVNFEYTLALSGPIGGYRQISSIEDALADSP